MSAWLTGLLIALLLGIAASLYLWLLRRRAEENAAGLHALAGMRWREFARLVLAAMERRGYRQISAGPEDVREQSANFLLGKDGRQLLLACKHGSAYRIGSATVDEIAADIRLRGAQGGILVTQGILDQGGRDKAARHDIEVLDGTRLWAELKPLVDEGLRKHVVDDATTRAGRHTGFAWLAAIALGAVVALLLPGMPDEANAVATASPSAPATATQAKTAPQPPVASVAAPPTEEELEKERAEVAKSMAGIDGLVRGIWISRSTLAVDRKVGEDLAWSLVCTELARHPNLALTRVQMNPPPGSDEQVRWRQCESIRR
ncbi:restriction endonuclease [Pseudoxanthomonas sangjuensis]|uniref:restriction endonuclease n=1 Tax=Pseudoxanthomonas sangjuensis TaxID=1503750 RepID=UPI001390ECB0|nr:restriction endonuclease [Pseudoxanthomonas sangjuensis]KAF1707884.1 hypothetical protein CSC71_12235 [Pseudoxanthomonas sangjuensis]